MAELLPGAVRKQHQAGAAFHGRPRVLSAASGKAWHGLLSCEKAERRLDRVAETWGTTRCGTE